jgi:multidrug efflux pump subunit AcrB
MDAIDQTLYDTFGEAQIATICSSTQQTRVILEAQPKFQTGPPALSSVYVANGSGGEVPLSAVARFVAKVEPLMINHQGVFPAVTLSFNLAPGAALSPAVDAIDALRLAPWVVLPPPSPTNARSCRAVNLKVLAEI